MSDNPGDVLEQLLEQVAANPSAPRIADENMKSRVEYLCHCSNRAGVRLVMACALAKIVNPTIDPRKPYTQIGEPDAFSGRHYDEAYIERFIHRHRFPLNPTTAFLTPALRNINHVLTPDLRIEGRPPRMYTEAFQLLDDLNQGKLSAEHLLAEFIRVLIGIRDRKDDLIQSLLSTFRRSDEVLPLSSEEIVKLISDHLSRRHSSRLPVLVVAAAYKAAQGSLGETIRPLLAHNAADVQTGAQGDVEVTLIANERVVTAYEMKMKPVTLNDIDAAIAKIARVEDPVDNYIFITTFPIDDGVRAYAASLYESSGGIEIAILDCIGFIRHFLHLFHRLRTQFLNNYQELVLSEPDSAVSPSLKEAFLVLRQSAEALHVLQVDEANS